MSCSEAPAASAAAAAAMAFWTFMVARPLKVTGNRWVQASCMEAYALQDVGDHPRRRGLAIGAGDSDDQNPARGDGWKQHVDHRLRHVLRVTDRRMGVHPEPGAAFTSQIPPPVSRTG
jgi:hypothetical protein